MHCLVRREQDGKELKETRVTQMAGTQRAWASDKIEWVTLTQIKILRNAWLSFSPNTSQSC